MTNLQPFLAIGIPMLVVLASLIISLVQISGIRDDVRGLRSKFSGLRADVRADINSLRSEMSGLRADMRADIGKISDRIELLVTGKVVRP